MIVPVSFEERQRDEVARRLADLMRPGHPVRQRTVIDAGLPHTWTKQVSEASQSAADDAAAVIAATDLAAELTSGRARVALALQAMVRGSDRRPPADEDPETRKVRVSRRLEGLDGVGIDEFLEGKR